MTTKRTAVPVIICRLHPHGSWCFTCPHCKTRHCHGPQRGLRIAHCTNMTSPFKETGYFLVLAEDDEAA